MFKNIIAAKNPNLFCLSKNFLSEVRAPVVDTVPKDDTLNMKNY